MLIPHQLRRLAFWGALLAFAVIGMGAYTRLSDAGLGCPDWPGCYGKWVVPQRLSSASESLNVVGYAGTPLESHKAWTEMIHRYLAGTLAIGVFATALVAWVKRKVWNIPSILPWILMGVMVFQAVLGAWTVTLKLFPPVVLGHLLGGQLIFSALFCLFRILDPQWVAVAAERVPVSVIRWGRWALGLLFVQIVLGGWMSSNYASLSCLGFPQCNGQWWPAMDFHHAFKIPFVGPNYQFGLLNAGARMAIHWSHRVWALVVSLTLVGWIGAIERARLSAPIRRTARVIGALLVIQWLLGIGNVVMLLPMWTAVPHHWVGALLLAHVAALNVQWMKARSAS